MGGKRPDEGAGEKVAVNRECAKFWRLELVLAQVLIKSAKAVYLEYQDEGRMNFVLFFKNH